MNNLPNICYIKLISANILFPEQDNKKSSDARWMRTVLSSGTASDKLAALTLMIQESPIHTVSCLDTLIGMVKKKGRREALMAIGMGYLHIIV